MFSPEIKKKWELFFSLKRAKIAFYLFISLYFVSLFSNFIANDKPLLVYYKNSLYFPIFRFYRASTFEQQNRVVADYKFLKKQIKLEKLKGFVLFPPISYGVNESLLSDNRSHPSPPSWFNFFGTDDRGRDIFTRLLYGFRISVSFALLLVMMSMIIGFLIGALQGYFGGLLDLSFQRITETIAALPFLYMIILIGSLLGQSFLGLLLIFSFFNWIGISYYIRGEYLRFRGLPFVESSKAVGMSSFKIMFKTILPNALTPVITFLPFEIISGVFSLTALDYLGFGLPAPTPSWGELLSQGTNHLHSWWLVFFSFLCFVYLDVVDGFYWRRGTRSL